MNIYEILFYGDSKYNKPMVCKLLKSRDDKIFKLGTEYCGELIKLDIIQSGKEDDFLKNTNELMIVNENVKNVLLKSGLANIQLIPCQQGEKTYYIVNVLNMLRDCLNLSESKVKRFPEDFPNERVRGKIGMIMKTVLNENKVQGHIFRIEEYPNTIYVDDFFREIILQNNFTGLDFHKVNVI